MRAAVITWDGGSNRQPFEVLCRGLLARDDVHVLSHDVHRRISFDISRLPPLPPGDYDAVLQPIEAVVPAPPPISIHVLN